MINGAIFGTIGAIVSTASFLPQTIKAVKTRSTRDISWGWLSMSAIGLSFWLLYGVYLGSIPMIISNLIMVGNLIIIGFVKSGGVHMKGACRRLRSKMQVKIIVVSAYCRAKMIEFAIAGNS